MPRSAWTPCLLALRTFFDPEAAEGLDARYELGLGESRFRIRISDGRIELARGEPEDPDAVIDTELGTLRELLWGGRALDDALRAGDITIKGDRRAVDRLLGLFPQPQPAAAAAVA